VQSAAAQTSGLGFPWWLRLQSGFLNATPRTKALVAATAVAAGVLLRVWAQTFPFNYDFESYLLVSDAVLAGESPYETNRYNYGPVWFLILGGLRRLFGNPDSFRLALTLTLTTVDLGIAAVLWSRRLPVAALLFLLAPTAISISGNHHQFDNLAVFLAILAAIFVEKSRDENASARTASFVIALALLSLSLAVKHVFILFPLWIALQERGVRRWAAAFAPPAVWLLALLPSFIRSPRAVLDNVFLYTSFNNAPLANLLLPTPLVDYLGGRSMLVVVFLIAAASAGIIYRRLPPFDSSLVYTVVMLLLSSAVADQYLAIPVAAAAVYLNAGFLLWLLGAVVYFWGVGSSTAIEFSMLGLPSSALGNYKTYHVVPLLLAWFILHRQLSAAYPGDRPSFLDRALVPGGLGRPTTTARA